MIQGASANGALVYRTVDKKSGDLVVQVPSATAINEVRQAQEFMKQMTARGRAATPVATPMTALAPGAAGNRQEKINGS